MKFGIVITLLCLTADLQGKDAAGIYMNASDYRNNILMYAADCGKEKFNIRYDDFLPTRFFSIKYEGKKYKMQKNSVYGYRNCNGDTYRFYDDDTYQIAEAGNIYIYTHKRNITQTKGFIVVNDYFFSTTPDGEIVRLSYRNLVNAYKENSSFLDALDNYKGDINAYDERHKMFKINYLYSISVNK